MDPKANTSEVQKERTTDPQDNEIAGNFIGDLLGQPKPAAQQAADDPVKDAGRVPDLGEQNSAAANDGTTGRTESSVDQ